MALTLLLIGIICIVASIVLFTDRTIEQQDEDYEVISDEVDAKNSGLKGKKTDSQKESEVFNSRQDLQSDDDELDEGLSDKEKGDLFEDYVIQYVAKATKSMDLRGKNADYHHKGVSGKENMEPDLKFSLNGIDFAIECKWRSRFINGKIDWAKGYQVNNYNKYQTEHKEPVFIAIGIGGEPDRPSSFYFLPLDRLTKTYATKGYIKDDEIDDKKWLLKVIRERL